MTIIKQLALTIVLAFFGLLTSAQAQTARLSTINVTSDGGRVHVAAQGDISEMRVDVADEQGDVIFQSGAITGNQLDWKMTDAQGERVAAGTYLMTVTFRTAEGKLRKRVEQVTVDEAGKSGKEMAASEPAAPQAVQATTGTPGKIAKFTGASTIGDSIITETGAGFIGIGTAAPQMKLTVQTGTGYYGLLHTDGPTRLATYVGGSSSGATGGWFGTSSNHSLHFFTNGGQPTMTITPAGSVGIGTSSPTAAARLQVRSTLGGDAVSGIANLSSSGTGVTGTGFVGVRGTGRTGVSGLSSIPGGWAMYADGNAGQNLASGGWIKAMAYVDENNNIAQCYNSTKTGSVASTPPCGFTSGLTSLGFRYVNFKFQVDNRFLSVSAAGASDRIPNTASFVFIGNCPTCVAVPTNPSRTQFMIIVY